MNSCLLAFLLFAPTAPGSTGAEPLAQMRAALDILIQAGSYSWTMRQEEESARGEVRSSNRFTGETMINGPTTIVRRRVPGVIVKDEAAYKVDQQWRLFADMTDAELNETHLFGYRPREFKQVLPHEAWQEILRNVTQARVEHGVLVGDIMGRFREGGALRAYLIEGRFPDNLRPGYSDGNEHATLSVWVDKGVATRIEIAVWRATVTLADSAPPRHHDIKVAGFVYELHSVGSTKVEIEPAAARLFSPANLR